MNELPQTDSIKEPPKRATASNGEYKMIPEYMISEQVTSSTAQIWPMDTKLPRRTLLKFN